MNQQLVKTLMVEIDGSVEKLRRALREGETGLKGFEQQSTKTSSTAAAASDAVANKQANAARGIAMATETIARQGTVSAEAAKQVIAQASNMAFALGPTGAVVGAVGISTLAIVAMFTRTRREMQETIDQARDAADAFDAMDATGQARAVNRLATGRRSDDAVLSTSEIMRRPDDDRANLFRERGLNRLQQDEARLLAEMRAASSQAPDYVRSRARVAELEAVRKALGTLSDEYKRNTAELIANAAAEAERNQTGLQREAATKAAPDALRAQERLDAERERERDREQEASMRARLQREEQFIAAQNAMHERLRTAIRDGLQGTDEDVRRAFDEMVKHAREHGGVTVPFLENLRDQALELNAAMRDSSALLDKLAGGDLKERILASGSRDRSGPEEGAIAALEERRDRLQAIANDRKRSDREQQAAAAEVAKLQTEIERRIASSVRERQQETKELRSQALAVGQSIDGVLQLMSAWGGVRSEVFDTLRGIVQIAANIPGLGESLDDLRSARAGGGKFTNASGTVVTTAAAAAGVAAAALPILGALTTIGASIFGDSPAEQERKRLQRENTLAIKDLTERVGSTGVNVGGSDLLSAGAEVAALVRALPSSARENPLLKLNLAGIGEEFDLTLLRKVAAELGITLDGTLGSFLALGRAIEAVEGKLGEFGDSLEDRTAVNDVLIDAKQITDPIARLTAQLSPATSMSPILQQLLGNADLSSAAGRDALRKQVIAILETMQAGGDALTADQMGALTRDQILQAINQILSGLGDIEANVPGAGSSVGGISGFRGLTEAAGERMADYLRGLYASATVAEGQRSRMIDILADLNAIVRSPLPVPALPSTAAARAAAGAGAGPLIIEGMRFEFSGNIVLNLDRETSGDEGAIAGAVLSSLSLQFEQVMYDAIRRGQKAIGDLSVSPMRLR